jgi:hypothetical protein
VFRLLAPLAAVAPKTFVESIIRCLALKKNELQIKERCKTTIDEEMNSHSYLTKVIMSKNLGFRMEWKWVF